MSHARSFIKVSSTYAAAEELRLANNVQSAISSFHRWHWSAAAATDISLSASTQDYTMAAGDQDDVMAIQNAYLTDASTTYAELNTNSDKTLPVTATEDRPVSICMISPTQIRTWPTPNATYTLKWRKHSIGPVFTVNTATWQIPQHFADVAKTGMVWQLLEYHDDERAPAWKVNFDSALALQKRREQLTMGRVR